MTQLRSKGGGADPLARASWRFRWQWWHLERRVAKEETRRLLASLRGWQHDEQPLDMEVITNAGRATTAVFRHGGWRAELGHVTRFGREALLAVSDAGEPLALRDAGRYGQFWWLAVGAGPERAVVLGATLRLIPEGGWGPGPAPEDGPQGRGLLAGQPRIVPLSVEPA